MNAAKLKKEKWLNSIRRRTARKILADIPLIPVPPEISPLTPEQLADIHQIFPLPKFFIFGYPRSGTTMLMRMVSLHPEVHCNRGGHFFTRQVDGTRFLSGAEIQSWLELRSNHWAVGKNMEAPLVRAAFDFLMENEARKLDKRVVGDKTPNTNNGEAVRRMYTLYPDACLVFILRDGRDAIVSHRFQYFIDHPEYLKPADRRIRDDYSQDNTPYFEKKRSLFTPDSLRAETELWVENVTETDRLGKELYQERYYCLRYEDFLKTPVDILGQVWSLLGVKPDFSGMQNQVMATLQHNPGADDQQKKEEKIAGNLPRGRQGGWKELFTPADRELFKSVAGRTLITWGYEKDLNW
jgi:hypothetical protein